MATLGGPALKMAYITPVPVSSNTFQSHGHSHIQQRLGSVALALCLERRRNGFSKEIAILK